MMKYLIFCIALGMFVSCGENTQSDDDNEGASEKKEDPNNIHEMNYALDDTIKMKSVENAANVPDGPFELTYGNGVIKAKGNLKNGQKDGLWESYYDDGTRWSSTYYKKGKPDGYSITYYKNGTVQYKGKYKDGTRVEHWEFYLDDGTLEKAIDY